MQNIIAIHSKKSFLSSICQHVQTAIDRYSFLGEVIFPNGILCAEFKSLLNKKYLQYIDVISVDKISLKKNSINSFDEKLLVANIIISYKDHRYDFIEAIKMSSEISNLFYKIEMENLHIDDLKICAQNLENIDHWAEIYKFLQYIYEEFYKYLDENSLISRAREQILSYETKIHQSKIQNRSIIMISSLNDDFYYRKFLQNVVTLKGSYLIFYPLPENFNKTDELNDPLFKISNLLKKLSLTIPSPSVLSYSNNQDNDLLKNLFSSKDSSKTFAVIPNFRIYFQEFVSSVEEYQFIVSKIRNLLAQNIPHKIAIITKNIKAKNFLTEKFDVLNIRYNDLIGFDVLESQVVRFLTLISDLLYNKFSVQKFLNLLSHKFLLDDNLGLLIKIFSKIAIFKIDTLEVLHETVKENLHSENDGPILSWLDKIITTLNTHKHSCNVKEIIGELCNTAESLYENLWKNLQDYNLRDTISAVINTKVNITVNHKHITQLIQNLFQGYRFYKNKSDAKFDIFIIRPEESGLVNFDYVFFIGFDEINYPSSYPKNNYLNINTQKILGIDLGYQQISKEIYHISLNLINSNLFITYSKKNFSGVKLSEAYFVKNLFYFFSKNIFRLEVENQQIHSKNFLQNSHFAKANYFPKEISATDLEMLIRSPYNFYAKKILGLKKQQNIIQDEFQMNIFGSLVHKAIYEYSLYRNFNKDSFQKQKQILETIIYNTINDSLIAKYSKRIYQYKMLSIINEFIEFDEERRKNESVKIYSEIRGNIKITIDDINSISLIAIADRIEIDQNGQAVVLDFKTGSLVSQKDVYLGLSPQLILESIILLEGGFKSIICNKILQLVYVKINSYSPYFTIKKIAIEQEDLLQHKKLMVDLLKYYLNNQKYYSDIHMAQYDDYSHIARRYAKDF